MAAALDEYDGLRPAWNRRFATTGRTSVVRFGGPDPLRAVIAALVRIADGEPWAETGLSAAQLGQSSADIRAVYEEVALELAGHTPAARQSESWLYRQTEMGLLLRRAQAALKAVDAPREAWFRLVPTGQPPA